MEIVQFCKTQDLDLSEIYKNLIDTLEEGKYIEANIDPKISLESMYQIVEDDWVKLKYFYTLLSFAGYLTVYKPRDYG